VTLAQKREVKKARVVLEDLVSDVLELLGYQFRTSNVEVVVQFDDGIAPIWADDGQLSQVLINLLMNAHQAVVDVPAGGRVRIEGKRAGNNSEISVIDNGPGIPARIRSQVFEPFFTTRSGSGGTGLGLSYCLNVVEGLGGTLQVGDSPQTGAVITMSLPSARERGREPALEPDMPTEMRSLRVLMVDDEIDLLDAMAESLEKLGHCVVGVTSGASALERLRSETFDVVLSDLRMQGMDGPELYRLACELQPRMRHRFVFITGDALADRVVRFLDGVELPQVNKPFDLETVRAVLRTFERLDHEVEPKTESISA
jgi:CheY-like chemotaxis protein